ncbi:MAG: DUF1848 domain-containing protein [Verrucomicrobiota bacterium]
MIISASYKTDIPTFYGEWFMNRLRSGHCKMLNPYSRRSIRVSLMREDVDGIVFWTKNVSPFLKFLPEIRERGIPFMVQHTINGYPRALEHSVVDAASSVRSVRKIADDFGPEVCIWRYDTIVMSSSTPESFHLQQFSRLAESLRGAVNEVVISFMQLYAKTVRNLNAAGKEFSFTWHDPSADEKRNLGKKLVEIAGSFGLRLSICAQRELLVDGAFDARCVDAERLGRIAGEHISTKLRGNRKECGCFASRDIGEYDTCPHGCVYCYAVRNQELALARYRKHNPNSEFLFEPEFPVAGEEESPQLSLI